MSRKDVETGLLRISEAVARLKAGMYGNFNRPEAVKEAKKHYPGASIGLGSQKEHAARIVDNALMKGELSVLVLPASAEGEVRQAPLQVPPDLLRKMIRTRGGLLDFAVQATRIFAKDPITPELRAALSKSALYVRCKEFDSLYKKARKKRNWPSQRSSKSCIGRPSKQSDLRDPIVVLVVNERRWSARQKIADLVRVLESKGIKATRDTVSRTVDQLFKETGEQCYRRRARKRSTVKRNGPGRSIPDI